MTQPPRMAHRLPMLRIETLCEESWAEMEGGRVRFCAVCERHVHDIASLRPRQVAALVAGSGERLCIRTHLRRDGTPYMRPERPPHLSVRRLLLGAVAFAACGKADVDTRPLAVATGLPVAAQPAASALDPGPATDAGRISEAENPGVDAHVKVSAEAASAADAGCGELPLPEPRKGKPRMRSPRHVTAGSRAAPSHYALDDL